MQQKSSIKEYLANLGILSVCWGFVAAHQILYLYAATEVLSISSIIYLSSIATPIIGGMIGLSAALALMTKIALQIIQERDQFSSYKNVAKLFIAFVIPIAVGISISLGINAIFPGAILGVTSSTAAGLGLAFLAGVAIAAMTLITATITTEIANNMIDVVAKCVSSKDKEVSQSLSCS